MRELGAWQREAKDSRRNSGGGKCEEKGRLMGEAP